MAKLSIRAWVRGARVLPMLAVWLAAGCGGPSMGDVSGVVTYNGEPLPSGSIVFMNDGVPNRYKVASTQISGAGRYHLPQVACGDVRITVSTPPPIGPVQSIEIPKDYADLEKSGLTYTVTSGSQTFDIKLSGPSAPPRKTGTKSLSSDERDERVWPKLKAKKEQK